MIYVCVPFCASSLLCLYSVTLSVLYITTKQATEYVLPCFIRIPDAILGLNGSRGQMEMMEAKLCLCGHQATNVSYNRPQATKNGLHTDFLWWRGVERLQSGFFFGKLLPFADFWCSFLILYLISWNDCFCDADTETK